ncbi:MAG TPA: type II secretion system F family protein [Vicinamibacterales bacterium]|nr:type II secretion system F family protein [Vicinamibacterales bacterium]
MAFVFLTFVLTLSIVLGAYYLFVVRPEDDDRSKLLRRLKRTGVPGGKPGATLERPVQQLSNMRALNAFLASAQGLSGPLDRLITQSGLPITVGTLLIACLFAACTGYLVVKLLTHFTYLGLAAAPLFGLIPYLFVRRARTKRLERFEEQFPESIELMARALRAGHSFPTALLMAGEEIPEPAGGEFKLVYDRQNFGMAMPDALKGFAERVPILDARFFVTAVLTQRETGGNLSEVLDNLASVIRDRFKVKRQVRVVTAHGRITGWILAGLPPSLAGVLCFISPDHMKMLITDPLGIQMVVAAGVMQITGTLIIRKLVNVPY